MEGRGDGDDAAACEAVFAGERVSLGGLDEVRDGGFDGVEGANDVDVDDRFKGW